MRKPTLLLILILSLTNCKSREHAKIEKFIWIQNNMNWIWQPQDLHARYFMEYFDSLKTFNFAHSTIIREKDKLFIDETDYFKSDAPRGLDSMIHYYLYGKKYLQTYEDKVDKNSVIVDDTDWYCIIYKFENQQEKIITYRQQTITDSLKNFVNYLETFKKFTMYKLQEPFDLDYYIKKYKKIIVDDHPFAPLPGIDSMIHYKIQEENK